MNRKSKNSHKNNWDFVWIFSCDCKCVRACVLFNEDYLLPTPNYSIPNPGYTHTHTHTHTHIYIYIYIYKQD